MNSFQQLNTYSNIGVAYLDDRPYSISFSGTPANYSISVTEGNTHQANANVNITAMTSANNVSYSINLSTAPNVSVVWPTPLPSRVTATTANNVYTVSNISSPQVWQLLKRPTVIQSRDFANNYTYTSTITYPNTANTAQSNTFAWTTTVTMSNLAEISTPTTFVYDEDKVLGIGGYPQITDAETDGIYTLVITPNVTAAVESISSNVTVSNTFFNTTTKEFVITGLRNQVNQHLAGLTMRPGNDYDQTFRLTYQLTNPVSGLISVVNQTATIGNINTEISGNIATTRTYDQHSFGNLFATAAPVIQEQVTDAVYDVSLTLSSNIGIIAPGNSFTSFPGWTQGNLTYNFSGTRDQVNAMFPTLRFFAGKNQSGNATVTYSQSRNGVVQTLASNTFALNGTAVANITGGTTSVSTSEDTAIISPWNQFTINPHYSDSVGIYMFPTVSGTATNNKVWFNATTTGWTEPNSVTDARGIYKNYTAPAVTSEYATPGAQLANITLEMYPDADQNFDIVQLATFGGTQPGNVGGTTYAAVKSVTVTPHADATVTTALNYQENVFANLVATISDTDSRSGLTYSVTLEQLSPDPATTPGFFWINNVRQPRGANVALTTTKTFWNAWRKNYEPPLDYTGNITLRYTQTKNFTHAGVSGTVLQTSNVITLTNTVTNLGFMYLKTDTSQFGNIVAGSSTGPNGLDYINSINNTNLPAETKHAANISNPRGDNASFRANVGELAPLTFRNLFSMSSPYTEASSVFRIDDGAEYYANSTSVGGNVSPGLNQDRQYTVTIRDITNKVPDWYYNTSKTLTTETYLGVPVQVFAGNSTLIIGPSTDQQIGDYLRNLGMSCANVGLVKLQHTVTRTAFGNTVTLFSGNTCNIRIQPTPGQAYQGGSTIWGLTSETYDQHPYTTSVINSTLGNITSPFNGRVAGTQDYYLITSNVETAVNYINSFANTPSMYKIFANTTTVLRSNIFVNTTWNDGLAATANIASLVYDGNIGYLAANTADAFTQSTYSDWYLPSARDIQTITNNYIGASGSSYQPPYGTANSTIYHSSTHVNNNQIIRIQGGVPVFSTWSTEDASNLQFSNSGKAIPVRRANVEY